MKLMSMDMEHLWAKVVGMAETVYDMSRMTQTYSCYKENVLKLDIGSLVNNFSCLIFDATSTIEHNMITHTVH